MVHPKNGAGLELEAQFSLLTAVVNAVFYYTSALTWLISIVRAAGGNEIRDFIAGVRAGLKNHVFHGFCEKLRFLTALSNSTYMGFGTECPYF